MPEMRPQPSGGIAFEFTTIERKEMLERQKFEDDKKAVEKMKNDLEEKMKKVDAFLDSQNK